MSLLNCNAECGYAERHYAEYSIFYSYDEYRYAELRYGGCLIFIITLNVVMLSVIIMLNIINTVLHFYC